MASNDLALGRIVEAVTHGKVWKETAIFVIEDDAQNGPDHVDAHRTVGLVISPYTSGGAGQHAVQHREHDAHDGADLGLPPLRQYDAAATPMFASFTDKADLEPYTARRPHRREEMNTKKSYGASESGRMDFSDTTW